VVLKVNGRSNNGSGPRRLRRREARRDVILRAAAVSFRSRGFADTGMRDIADAADLSPANLYHYFRGKDEILFYCQNRALDRMLTAVTEARRIRNDAAARLEHVLTRHLQTLLDDVEGATAHVEVDALPLPLRTKIVAKRDRYERALRRLLEAGIAHGEFVADDPAIVARAMLGALNWTVTWFDPAGPQPAHAISETVARFLVRGVLAGRPLSRRTRA
jgi:AcrR family transcriptional regulator